MTVDDMIIALEYLSIRFPYGILPGSMYSKNGQNTNPAATRETWNAYRKIHNPPPFLDIDDPDPDADELPTFEDLTEASIAAKSIFLRQEKEIALRRDVRRRITAAHNETDVLEEILKVLVDGRTPEETAERSRLLARYLSLIHI